MRPPTALGVAAALPGGDPLAAALAAGETPSPQMVAAAGDTDVVPLRTVLVCLACVLIGLVGVVAVGSQANVLQKTPFDKPPEALAEKARELIRGFGYTDPPADHAEGLGLASDYQRYAESQQSLTAYRAQLSKGQPPLIFFWYRQSPRNLEPVDGYGMVREDDPPDDVSGMVDINLDPQGRLTYFIAYPPQVEEPLTGAPPSTDWAALFKAAGIDQTRFAPVRPKWLGSPGFDNRAAWTGTYVAAPEIPLRIEAASWRGKPVYFQVIGPWKKAYRMTPYQGTAAERVRQRVELGLILFIFGAACLLAWRHFRLAKGDVPGASRLAMFTLVCYLIAWACFAKHQLTLGEYGRFTWGLSAALFIACAYWVLYIALEPYVRRRWPQGLITWSRLLAGGFRDPMVGGHVLIGVAFGVVVSILFLAENLVLEPYGSTHYGPTQLYLESVLGVRKNGRFSFLGARFFDRTRHDDVSRLLLVPPGLSQRMGGCIGFPATEFSLQPAERSTRPGRALRSSARGSRHIRVQPFWAAYRHRRNIRELHTAEHAHDN